MDWLAASPNDNANFRLAGDRVMDGTSQIYNIHVCLIRKVHHVTLDPKVDPQRCLYSSSSTECDWLLNGIRMKYYTHRADSILCVGLIECRSRSSDVIDTTTIPVACSIIEPHFVSGAVG